MPPTAGVSATTTPSAIRAPHSTWRWSLNWLQTIASYFVP